LNVASNFGVGMKEQLIKDIKLLLKTVTVKELRKNPLLREKNRILIGIVCELIKEGSIK
jgi:hypothetical protein